MFECEKTIKDVMDMVNESIDISDNIGDSSFILWVNEVEQLLYSDIIKEHTVFKGNVALPYVPAGFRFEDIHKLYINGIECAKATAGTVFEDTFFKTSVNIDGEVAEAIDIYPNYSGDVQIKVIYFARPTVKTAETDTIKLPIEWLKIVLSYCKSMAYKEYNEFNAANNWIAEYNAYAKDFSVWIESKKAVFGR